MDHLGNFCRLHKSTFLSAYLPSPPTFVFHLVWGGVKNVGGGTERFKNLLYCIWYIPLAITGLRDCFSAVSRLSGNQRLDLVFMIASCSAAALGLCPLGVDHSSQPETKLWSGLFGFEIPIFSFLKLCFLFHFPRTYVFYAPLSVLFLREFTQKFPVDSAL